MQQEIQYCATPDGVRLAYSMVGKLRSTKLLEAACGAHHRRSLGIHSGLCGCENFEVPNFGTSLHREPLFISAHMCLTTEAHPVVAIYNRPQMAATVIAAVHDSLGRLWKAWCHSYPKSPVPNCIADLLKLTS
jgi:hypothetical protein